MFRFQQFTIHDDRCAMKVGTDGVLLGAWAALPDEFSSNTADFTDSPPRVLDVGTGSGVVALMLAQRYPQAHIFGLELDESAAQQAQENAATSPFAAQVTIQQGDFLSDFLSSLSDNWHHHYRFDAIVSNPPYFEETLLSPNQQRAQARHVHHGLTFEALTQRSAQLLSPGGTLQVILPKTAQPRFVRCAQDAGFTLLHQTDIQTVARKSPKRVLLRFQLHHSPDTTIRETTSVIDLRPTQDTLILMENGARSAQYAALCHDFYLTPAQLNEVEAQNSSPKSPTAAQ